jgi:putative hydrolase of the HAD superfamily
MEQVTSPFRTVLFDCDGVLQRPANDWRAELLALVPDRVEDEAEAFLEDIRLAEKPTMDGSADFAVRLQEVLDRWRVATPAEDVLPVWQQLWVDPEMLEAAADLRAAGLVCALATNQHNRRAEYMRRELGYQQWFDPCFYSCEVGLAKPDPDYFRVVVERLGVPGSGVLFVDDVLENVQGAREAGLVAEHFERDAGRPELDRILALHGLGAALAA